MIHGAPIKLDKQYRVYIKKIFRYRLLSHYKTINDNIRMTLKYWGIYLYALIGFIVGTILLQALILSTSEINSDLNSIYFSALFFLISIQFSIHYFFQPADSIHFRQRKEIILMLRTYAINHAVISHSINWAFIFTLLSQVLVLISEKDFISLFCIYLFTVSFTLTICMIRKEFIYYLRERHKAIYLYIKLVIFLSMYIWYTIIFTFADVLYIGVGILVNVLIFLFTYKWGSHIVMPTLHYLIDSDKRNNMLTAAIAGSFPQYESYMKLYKAESSLFKKPRLLTQSKHYKVVVLEIITRRLLRTSSYHVQMLMLYGISGLSLFIIKSTNQFIVLAIVTFYISFLIHKQHVEYFNTNLLMSINIKQGLNVKLTDLKLTALLTTPVIILMLIVFIVLP